MKKDILKIQMRTEIKEKNYEKITPPFPPFYFNILSDSQVPILSVFENLFLLKTPIFFKKHLTNPPKNAALRAFIYKGIFVPAQPESIF